MTLDEKLCMSQMRARLQKQKIVVNQTLFFCHSANRALVQLLVFSDVARLRVLLTHSPQEILPKNAF